MKCYSVPRLLFVFGHNSLLSFRVYRSQYINRRRSNVVLHIQDYIMRQQIVDEALRLDSLEHISGIAEIDYITNVQDIFTGRVNVDTVLFP